MKQLCFFFLQLPTIRHSSTGFYSRWEISIRALSIQVTVVKKNSGLAIRQTQHLHKFKIKTVMKHNIKIKTRVITIGVFKKTVLWAKPHVNDTAQWKTLALNPRYGEPYCARKHFHLQWRNFSSLQKRNIKKCEGHLPKALKNVVGCFH